AIRGGIATRGQKDFAKLYPKFDAEMESIQSDLPKIPDSEVVLRLRRLIASANVAHNDLATNSYGFFLRLPLTVYWFRDGLAVISAAPEYSSALGSRVVKISTMTPEQLLPMIAPYISHENEITLKEAVPRFITTRAMLEH